MPNPVFRALLLVAALGGLLSCASDAPAPPVAAASSDLYLQSGTPWPAPWYIPVCWLEDGHETEKGWVRDQVRSSWSTSSAARFVGWGRCADTGTGVAIHIADERPWSDIGTDHQSHFQHMTLNFSFAAWNPGFDCGPQLEFCVRAIAGHEFGHVLGFAHEQNRPDTPDHPDSDCDDGDNVTNSGDTMLGPYDEWSVMNYCNNRTYDNGGNLSTGDVAGVQRIYGTPVYEGRALSATQYLVPGFGIQAKNGFGKLAFDTTGELIVYGPQNERRFSAGTGAQGADVAILQGDGNFVVYDTTGRALWSTRSFGHSGAQLVMQNDGNLVVYDGNTAVWNSHTRLPAPSTCRVMNAGEVLERGETLKSCNGLVVLTLDAGGDLQVIVGGERQWHTDTSGSDASAAILQPDGNFVLYDRKDHALWSSGTSGHAGAQLRLQNDENLVLYALDGSVLWSTHTAGGNPTGCRDFKADQVLWRGDSVRSCNGALRLTLQDDGNLVLYDGSHALWSSGTYGRPSRTAIMQGDGNLVVYDGNDQKIWSTGTYGNPKARLAVQADGNLVVYSASGTALWSSGSSFPRPSGCRTLTARHQLARGDFLRSCDGETYLNFKMNGNLVLYRHSGDVVWVSNTGDRGGYTAVVQADGNFVIYALSTDRSIWSSGTDGYPGAHLDVQNDGNMVVYDANGHARWETDTDTNVCNGIHCGTACCANGSWCGINNKCCTEEGMGCGVTDFAAPPPF